MLITEASFSSTWFQQIPKDTIKKVKVDTLDEHEETLDTKVIYNARDSIRYEHKGKRVLLFGDAYVEYGSTSMKAEYIVIDNARNLIKAYGKRDSTGAPLGNPLFKDGADELVMDTIVYNLKTKKGKMYNVQTKQADLLIYGSEIKKDSNDVVYFKNLKCVPCQYNDARTIFKASKAKVIPDDKIVTGPMYLEIGGVPTPLALPFGYFPNSKKRHSGLLLPFYGNSEQLGFYLKDGGFYWGISDQTDMTIRGDIYTNGSWGLRTVNNYNVMYKFNGALSLGFSQFRFGEKEIPSTVSKQRSFSINWRHNQDNKNNPKIRFSSNVNVVTSHYNKYNAINTGQYLTNTFQSNINLTRIFKTSSLSINARHNQNTQTRIMEISFPELTYNVNRFFPFKRENATRQNALDKLGISYLLEARNTLHGMDSTIFKGNLGDSLKYGIRHTLPISTNMTVFKYFTLTPSLNMSAVMYTKTYDKHLDYASDRVLLDTVKKFKTGFDANFTTALTTKVFTDYVFKSKRLKQIRHLLIPTVSYMYRPDFGSKQYGYWKDVVTDTTTKRTTKYSIFENGLFGGPAAQKQNSINFSLSNNVEAKIRQKTDSGYVYNKVTILQNVGISGGYNFAADSMNMSNYTVTGRTKIWKFFDLVFNSSFDPYALDPVTKNRIKQYAINTNGKLVRFVSGNIALNASFSSNVVEAMKKKKQPDLTNGAEQGAVKTAETSQKKLPWNLNVYYNINLNKSKQDLTKTQTLNFSGDVRVTQNWKIGMTSGYDFINKNFSYTSVNLYRDLHCWEARIDWVPFGFRKSYSLSINLKTSMLSDIKVPRQRQWYDNL
ncbi:MAG: LPS-assembly protein LptD [Bacteroidetes bacterium]|nr:LPS-assembly protein LptD [Bacteroidota bacterium]